MKRLIYNLIGQIHGHSLMAKPTRVRLRFERKLDRWLTRHYWSWSATQEEKDRERCE